MVLRIIYQLFRWLDENEKEAQATDTGEDLDQNEELTHEFLKWKDEYEVVKDKFSSAKDYAGPKPPANIKKRLEDIQDKVDNMDNLVSIREENLRIAAILHKFFADTQDVIFWINENDRVLKGKNKGDCLKTADKLLKEVEKLDPEIKEKNIKVKDLHESYKSIETNYPKDTLKAATKLQELNEVWPGVVKDYQKRKKNLRRSVDEFKYINELETIEDNVTELTNLANDDRSGKNSTDYQNNTGDLRIIREKLNIAKQDLRELVPPPEMDMSNRVSALKSSIKKCDNLLDWGTAKLNADKKINEVKQQVDNVVAWTNYENVKDQSLDENKDLMNELSKRKGELETLSKKEDGLKLIVEDLDDVGRTQTAEGAVLPVVDMEEVASVECCSNDASKKLQDLKKKKEKEINEVEALISTQKFVHKQEALSEWIAHNNSQVSNLVDGNITQIDEGLTKLEITKAAVDKAKEENNKGVEAFDKSLTEQNVPLKADMLNYIIELKDNNLLELENLSNSIPKHKDHLEEMSKLTKARNSLSAIDEWIVEKSNEINVLRIEPDIASINSASTILSDIEAIKPVQAYKLEVLQEEIDDLKNPEILQGELDDVMRKYHDLISMYKYACEEVKSCKDIMEVKQGFNVILLWMKEAMPIVMDGYVGNDYNDILELSNRYTKFFSEYEAKAGEYNILCDMFTKLPTQSKTLILDIQSESMKKWQEFAECVDSRKDSIADGLKIHELLTESSIQRETALEKLRFLQTIGSEKTLWAVQKAKKRLDTIEDYIPILAEFIDTLVPKLKKYNGQLLICGKDKFTRYKFKTPFTIRDLANSRIIEIPISARTNVVCKLIGVYWQCMVRINDEDEIHNIPVVCLTPDYNAENLTALSVTVNKHNELFAILEKLTEVFGLTESTIGKLYLSMLLGESSSELMDWIKSVDRWMKMEFKKVPKYNRVETETVFKMCDDFIDETKERKELVSNIEAELAESVPIQHCPKDKLDKAEFILDKLKDQFKSLHNNLDEFRKELLELAKFQVENDNLKNLNVRIIGLIEYVLKYKIMRRGNPKYIYEMEATYQKDLAAILDHVGLFIDHGIRKPNGLSERSNACNESLQKLGKVIDELGRKEEHLKTLKEYEKTGAALNDVIDDIKGDLNLVKFPEYTGNDNDFLIDIEIAEADLERIGEEKARYLDPEMTPFVLQGIELIHRKFPYSREVKTICEDVQDNFEGLDKIIKVTMEKINEQKQVLPDDDSDGIQESISYLSDVFSERPKDLTRESLLLEKSGNVLEKLKMAVSQKGRDPSAADKFRNAVQKLSNDYLERQKEAQKLMRVNEYLLACKKFREPCQKSNEEMASLLDEKNFESIVRVSELYSLNIEQCRPEYKALIATGENLLDGIRFSNEKDEKDEKDEQAIKEAMESLELVWKNLTEGHDKVDRMREIKKMKMSITSYMNLVRNWIISVNNRIDSDEWLPNTNQLQNNKKMQGEFLIQNDVNEVRIKNIYSEIKQLSSIDAKKGEKLANKLSVLKTEFEGAKRRLRERQEVLDNWESVIHLIPLILYETAWIEDQIVKMEVEWTPENATEAIIRLKKVAKMEADLETGKHGTGIVPADVPDVIPEINDLYTNMKAKWEYLISLVSKAKDSLEGYRDMYDWETKTVIFIEEVNNLLSEIDPDIEETSVPSLNIKFQAAQKLKNAGASFDDDIEEILAFRKKALVNIPIVEDVTDKAKEIYSNMKNRLNDNEILTKNLLERSKLILKIQDHIDYDSSIKKKILVLDRCGDLTLAFKRLSNINQLEDKVKASAEALKTLEEEAEKLKLSEDYDTSSLPVEDFIIRAIKFHEALVLQMDRTKTKILNNNDTYKNRLEALFLEYKQISSNLTRWIEDIEEHISDGVTTDSLKEAIEQKKSVDELSKEAKKYEEMLEKLFETEDKIREIGDYDNPYTYWTYQQIEMVWRNLNNLIVKHGNNVTGEIHRQETIDSNRKMFAGTGYSKVSQFCPLLSFTC